MAPMDDKRREASTTDQSRLKAWRRSHMKLLSRKPALIAATIALLGAGAALQNLALAAPLSEVVIEAGPINRTVVGRSATTGAPIESITVDHRVDYSDLDLVKHVDVLTLQQRVEMAARDACAQLDEVFPIGSSYHQTRTCIEEAIHGASQAVQQAITSAQEHLDQD